MTERMRTRVVGVYSAEEQADQAMRHLESEGLAEGIERVETDEGLIELVAPAFQARRVIQALERVNVWSVASH